MNSIPTIVTILGIRPDLIRMSMILKKLDENFHHIFIHTGQHYDRNLSDIFYEELEIRKPDYLLETGKKCKNHYEQLSYLSKEIPELLKRENIKPDLILLLADANTSAVSVPLKKEGYCIGHIEAGMRSYDKRMLEEINRIVCDVCSDILFVYHEDYKQQLFEENIKENVFVVGNTIVEPMSLISKEIISQPKQNKHILVDIHRPENSKKPLRVQSILNFARNCSRKYNLPVKLLYFKQLQDTIHLNSIDLDGIQMVPLMGFKEYLQTVYDSRILISDSGTAQEEPILLNTPTIITRDFTERPQSFLSNCSFQYFVENPNDNEAFEWITKIEAGQIKADKSWLGDGQTSSRVIDILKTYLVRE